MGNGRLPPSSLLALPGNARYSVTGHVARMPAQEVISHPPADRIELDSLADDIASGRNLVAVERQHLGGQHLQVQRHREPVLESPGPEAEEHFPGNEHLARRPPL